MQRGGHLLRQGLKCDLYVNTKKGDPSDKLPISKTDRELIQKWKGGSGITAEIALSVSRQGWISSKQRTILHKDGRRTRVSGRICGGNHQQADYDESDYEIGAYELCVGEWGD